MLILPRFEYRTKGFQAVCRLRNGRSSKSREGISQHRWQSSSHCGALSTSRRWLKTPQGPQDPGTRHVGAHDLVTPRGNKRKFDGNARHRKETQSNSTTDQRRQELNLIKYVVTNIRTTSIIKIQANRRAQPKSLSHVRPVRITTIVRKSSSNFDNTRSRNAKISDFQIPKE